MTRQTYVSVIFAGAAVCITAALANEQSRGPATFDLSWHTIDGGGGMSTGGSFVLSGTIGQHDAAPGAMTGGTFELAGGFWAAGGPATPACPADLANDDGLVNVFDLFVLLGSWNTAGPGAELAPPLNVADVFDLFVLLDAWGTCE